MPATKRPKPLYQRGIYSLYPRAGRALEIVWYDSERRRERSASAGTDDVTQGKLALDRRYLADGGHDICPTCLRPIEAESPLLSRAIVDYLLSKEGTPGYKASSTRLTPAVMYLAETSPTLRCAQADAVWIGKYRSWLAKRPVVDPKGRQTGTYSLEHQEGCVRALASAVNAATKGEAQFKALQPKETSNSPKFRSGIEGLAAMFNYCLRPQGRSDREREARRSEREQLLRFLRMAVATWARPDAIYDAGEKQWTSAAGVLDLNTPGRRQTIKHRPKVVIARQFRPFLDSGEAFLSVSTINGGWARMARVLNLPTGRQAGPKLVRRSVSTLARKIIGEAQWQQGKMMLGHQKFEISDIYALPDPASLGLALAATEGIIDGIEKLAPGAFYRAVTAQGGSLRLISGPKKA